mgnify:FL=1
MKRNRILSSILAAVTAAALFVLPAAAAEKDVFPHTALAEAVKDSAIYVKESEDRGRDITLVGSKATLAIDVENNTDYLYQWEYLDEDGAWQLIGGANGSVYHPIDNLKSGKTYTIRCVLSLRNGRALLPSRLINVTVA